jgi:hypothetical protein
MEKTIKKILSDNLNFEFLFSEEKSVKHLKNVTQHIPNDSGVYLVFCEEELKSENSHLIFQFSGKNLTLVYFGKAGGLFKSGEKITQGLNGRINNVVSNDIKRANHWKKEMEINKISKFFVFCQLNENPTVIENEIYDFLDRNGFSYPLMNKKRGKPSKGNKRDIL